MKTEKIIWGITLVFIGTILLLDNFGVIDFYWRSVWQFWPLILILVGLNLVFGRDKVSNAGSIAMIIITCLVLGFVSYVGITRTNYSGWGWSDNAERNEEDTLPGKSGEHFFNENFTPGLKYAELHIEGGATSYEIKETTDQLFAAEVKQSFGRYTLTKTTLDSIEVLRFKMKGNNRNWNLDEIGSNEAFIRLNTNPIWDIHLKLGAGSADFDLSKHKVSKLHIEGGAAKFNVVLGQPADQTVVTVDAGVTEVRFSVPKNVACQIKLKTGLTKKNFRGFEKQSDGTYLTPNYQAAAKKIMISLTGGLSEFQVNQY